MKIVTTADWHVANFSDFSKSLMTIWDSEVLRFIEVSDDVPQSKEMNSRLLNILNGLCDMRDYCKEHEIFDVLMAGDCFHKRGTIEVTVYNSIYKVLESYFSCGITVHMIAGNHDQVDSSQQPISSIHGFKEIVHVIEEPTQFCIERGEECEEVIAIPYSKDKEFVVTSIKTLREQCISPEKAILVAHMGVTGGTVGSGMYSMKDEYTLSDLKANKFKYVVLGHYHQPQCLSKNSIYSGTPVQNSFSDELKGEDGYNGFFVLDTSKRYDMRFVPIMAPRFVTCESSRELNKLDQEFISNNYVRVKSSAKDAEEIQGVLEDLFGDSISGVRVELEKEYDTDRRSDIGISQTFEDAVKTYADEHFDDAAECDVYKKLGLDILAQATVGGKY